MNTTVLAEAEAELGDAVAYYEELEPGLGLQLKDEARAAITWIVENPKVPRLRPKGYRRVNLSIFPYFVAYAIVNDVIWVLAFAHGHRRPEYWIGRKAQAR